MNLIQSSLIEIHKLSLNTGQIPDVPKNPRFIRDERFKKLVKSLEDNPEMLPARELLVYNYEGELIVIGGNMRLRAAKELGYKEIPCKILEDLTAEQIRAIVIKDNVSFGSDDFEQLANEWDSIELEEWGMEVPNLTDKEDEIYTTKIESPIYMPKEEKPKYNELFDLTVYNKLLNNIKNAQISESERLFLQLAATRHIEFNYRKIADFYAHSDIEVQNLIEDSALIIIDYEKAIEKGFVKLYDDVVNLSDVDI